MKTKFLFITFLALFLWSCAGVSSKGIFGTGVSVAFDALSMGQILCIPMIIIGIIMFIFSRKKT